MRSLSSVSPIVNLETTEGMGCQICHGWGKKRSQDDLVRPTCFKLIYIILKLMFG